jgi:hypothetical protein
MSEEKIKLLKNTKTIFDSAKDSTISKIIEMNNAGILKLDRDQLVKVVDVIRVSLEESYSRSSVYYEKEVNKALDLSKKK